MNPLYIIKVTTARADLVFQAVVKPKGMMSFKSQMDLPQFKQVCRTHRIGLAAKHCVYQ